MRLARLATIAALAPLFAAPIGCGDPAPAESPGSSGSSGDSPTTIDPSMGPATSAEASTGTGTSSATTSASDDTDVDTGIGHSDILNEEPDPCADYDELATALARDEAADRVARTEAFLADAMRSEHGLPLVCDGRLVFVLWDGAGGTLSVTGDFAAWDPEAYPLVPLVDGFDLMVADIAMQTPLAPSLYKFVRNGDTYFADPRARRHAWDEFGEYSLTDARPDASHVERHPDFTDGGGLQPRTLTVFVPAGALADAAPDRPVISMHDGQNLFSPEAFFGGWQVMQAVDEAISTGAIEPVFVVGIDNTSDRFDEYTPWPDDLGDGPVGGRADEYAALVALAIKPFIDERYPTRPGPESTAIVGSSLGGLVSLWIAAEYPEIFGHAGSLSGTLGWGQIGASNDRIIDRFDATPPDGLWIYLDSGGDGPCPGGSDNYCETVEMRDVLLAHGWTEPETLRHVHAPGASHDEAAWAARMPGVLESLGLAFAAQ